MRKKRKRKVVHLAYPYWYGWCYNSHVNYFKSKSYHKIFYDREFLYYYKIIPYIYHIIRVNTTCMFIYYDCKYLKAFIFRPICLGQKVIWFLLIQQMQLQEWTKRHHSKCASLSHFTWNGPQSACQTRIKAATRIHIGKRTCCKIAMNRKPPLKDMTLWMQKLPRDKNTMCFN